MKMALNEISFFTTTFTIQIHGLPPVYLHEQTVQQIENMMGSIHIDSISKKCIAGNHYLKFKIDLSINNPLPPGFLQEREDGDERWIQFKFEKLLDFCYKCGKLDHVTRACWSENPATITTAKGIISRLYGLWIRAEHGGSLLFINVPDSSTARSAFIRERQNFG